MNPQTAADLAQVLADLNRSAVSDGRAPAWTAVRPATLSAAVAAHQSPPPVSPALSHPHPPAPTRKNRP
jgi:hypothetical protein